MSAITNIVIADAVPANHTYLPQSASMALSTWSAAAAYFEANERIAISMSQPTSQRKTSRVRIVHTVPFARLESGVLVRVDNIIFTTDAVIPSGCTESEALGAYAQHKNLQATTVVQDYLGKRTPVW